MGLSKTKVAVDFVNCMHLMEGVTRVLVVCPLSVMGVWEAEVAKHTPDDMLDKIEWVIVNYESVFARANMGGRAWMAVPHRQLHSYAAQVTIVDESHRIGNPGAMQAQHIYALGRRSAYRVILTGTMFHRKPFYTFGQAKFYDPSIFGTAFTDFKKRIAVFGGYGKFQVIRYRNLGWMMKRMKKFVYIEKYVPTHTTVENVLWFKLTGTNLAHYKSMEKESMTVVDGEPILSTIVLSRHLRCQMIASGWLRKANGKYAPVGDDKLRMGMDRFQSYAEAEIPKVVVACRFIPDLKNAYRAAKAAGYHPLLMHGGIKPIERTTRIKQFQEMEGKAAFIMQINTGREGIDLSAADTMLFWSLSESYVDHDQTSRRIEKFGDKRTLQYDYLVAKGTRDEVTYRALKLKQDVATYIADDPERVERITAKAGML